MNLSIKGFVKLEAFNPETGERRLLADWFPNQILLSGMAVMDQRSDWMTWCQVGTSNVAVNENQSSLQGWVEGTNTLAPAGSVPGVSAGEPFYGWRQTVFRFDPRVGGNIILQEVGVGWGSGSGGTGEVISRALIVDINGTPISPSWVDGEQLDVTYELRYYPPLNDVLGFVELNGIGYNTTLRAAYVQDTFTWGTGIGGQIGVRAATGNWVAWDTDIGGLVDAGPTSGLSANCDNANQYDLVVAPAYTVGLVVDCGSAGWNLTNDMRTLVLNTTAGRYQIQFDADGSGGSTPGDPIPKDNTFTMAFQFNLTWNWEEFSGVWIRAAAGAGTPAQGEWNNSVADTDLRLNWIDADLEGIVGFIIVPNEARFTIVQENDATKWVEYTKTVSQNNGGDYTEYQVTQTGIENSGPAVGQRCTISVTPL